MPTLYTPSTPFLRWWQMTPPLRKIPPSTTPSSPLGGRGGWGDGEVSRFDHPCGVHHKVGGGQGVQPPQPPYRSHLPPPLLPRVEAGVDQPPDCL